MNKSLFQLDRRDGAIYRQWARWMLGLDYGYGPLPSSMTAADSLYRQEGPAIRRAASAFAASILPRVWGPNTTTRTLYRGLRLEDPDLHGKPLPPDPRYARLAAFSFTEDRSIACNFADPGAEGVLALPILNPATGQRGLPPHGYIGTATIDASDVLLHWRYVMGVRGFFTTEADELRLIATQQEVTVRAHPGVSLQLEAFHLAAGDYIAARYPGGEWQPAPSFTTFPAELFR